MEAKFHDDAGEYAREGDAAHTSAAVALLTGTPARSREGLSDELLPFVQEYVDLVERIARGKKLHIEKRLKISAITGEKNAYGTADAVIVGDDEITVVDLKFGRGVKVDAALNPQLMIYGLAAKIAFPEKSRSIRLVIFQPRLHHLSEFKPSTAELADFSRKAWERGKIALEIIEHQEADAREFMPSEETCRFCRARSGCKALAEKVQKEVGADFETLAQQEKDFLSTESFIRTSPEALARAFRAVPIIESWCRAVAAEVERRMHAGDKVPGYKFVAGRKGARYWSDSNAAADALRALQFSASDIYEQKIISPAQAEKIFKASGMDAEYWKTVRGLIMQNDAKPVIVPESDKRPALNIAADVLADFD